MTVLLKTVIARSGADEEIHSFFTKKNGLLRRFAPLRKRFAFVAGNDDAGAPTQGRHTPRMRGYPLRRSFSIPSLASRNTGSFPQEIVSCVALATLKIRGVMSDNFCGSFRVRHIRQAPARKSLWEDQMTANLAAPRACTAIVTVILCSTTALPTIATAADRGLGTDEAAACAAMSSAGTGATR